MQLLRKCDIDLAEPEIVARTAWTSDELSEAIDALAPNGPFDLVSLLVGVNDQYRGRPVHSFAGEFAQLLRRARSFAGKRPSRVIAISIPDWGATPYAEGRDRALISREIDAYNKRARELTVAAGAHWVNVTDISRRMQSEPQLIAPDGLHPSGEMYRSWAELLLPVAQSALAASRV
jgi:lysophospholipase L1-like esterase